MRDASGASFPPSPSCSLHLWSLGIEEQFYIAWPLLLWFTWKGRVNLRFLTMAIIAASFGLSVETIHIDSVAAFYSP